MSLGGREPSQEIILLFFTNRRAYCGMKKRLLYFEENTKGAYSEILFTLLHTVIDRIYITTEGSTQKCQIYIKAAPKRTAQTSRLYSGKRRRYRGLRHAAPYV
jgi:hypothetical protein